MNTVMEEAYRMNQEFDIDKKHLEQDKRKLLELVRRIEFVNIPKCQSKDGQSAVMWVKNSLVALAYDIDSAVRRW